MKNRLGVVGNPRRSGNTHILVSRVLDGAREVGADTDIVFLDSLNIWERNGCYECRKGGNCPKNNDMNALSPVIAASDVTIFGTPVYWYGPTASMKAFIDRQ